MKTFIGRITSDATVNTTKNDKQVVNFCIIENHSYTTKEGERREEKNFYNCAYWRSTGVAKYLTKGTLVEINGNLTVDAFLNKENKPKASLKVHVSEIVLLAKPSNKQVKHDETKVTESEAVTEPVDDLPF
jgi:single-strand DNA-binding protein